MSTYEWQAAVAAGRDLWLVGVDKDSGMSCRSVTTVACDNFAVCPPDWLLVDELDGGFRLRLFMTLVLPSLFDHQ